MRLWFPLCGVTSDSLLLSWVAQRLEQLPASSALKRLVARISAGGWFEFYDLFMTGYIALGLVRHGLFSMTGSDWASFAGFVAAGFAGMFVGTLLFGWTSDRFGRKATFTWSLVFYSLMTCAMALAPTAVAIDILRFFAGAGIGVQIVTIDAYITEIAPKQTRGSLIALSQTIGYTAVPVVAFIAYGLVPHTIAGLDGWRWVALGGALGAIVVWPVQAGLPESPRWLASRNRAADAQASLRLLESIVAGETTPADASTVQAAAEATGTDGHLLTIARLFGSELATRTIILASFNFFQTLGFYGFAAWLPTLLNARGITVTKSLEYTALIAIVTPIGPLLATRFADRSERKHQIVALALSSAIFVLALATQSAPWAILLFGALTTLVNTWFSSAFHAYQSEVFPTAIRAGAVGFVYSWSRLGSIFVGYLYAAILHHQGPDAAFAAIAFAMLVSALIVGLFGPLTNRRQLEALAQ